MNRIVPISLFFIFLAGFSWGQSAEPSVVNSAGGHGESASMSIVWSLGEVVTETFQSDDRVLTQGLLQPDILVTLVEEAYDTWHVEVFPNPAKDMLTVRAEDFRGQNVRYSMIDVNGNVVKQGTINGNTVSFAISDVSPGMYFLRLYSDKEQLKVFKIVKQ